MRQFYVALVLLIMRESFSCFLSHFDVLVVLMSQSFLCCISFYDIFVVLMHVLTLRQLL